MKFRQKYKVLLHDQAQRRDPHQGPRMSIQENHKIDPEVRYICERDITTPPNDKRIGTLDIRESQIHVEL